MSDTTKMRNGRIVKVQLHGDPTWFRGKVIKAKKMWVQLDAGSYYGSDFIADECSIKKWRYSPISNTGQC